MHVFDYSWLKEDVPADLIGITNIIPDLKARDLLRRSENEETLARPRQTAMIESVKGSNAIEGIVTTAKRLTALVRDGDKPVSHAEEEILGYKMALSEIYHEDFDADLSKPLLKHFHRLLLSPVSSEAGQYKKQNNRIQERDENGKLTVRFVPVKAKDTPGAMEQWILAWNEWRQNTGINCLFLIPCVVLDFLCIHPFTDGNGRLSRLITIVMLQQAGFDISRYISLEARINEYKYGYYQSLRESSVGWHENRNTYYPFITYFLRILYACYREMDEKFIESQVRMLPKHQQVENVLLNSFVPVSKADVMRRLPHISVTTVEKVMADLLREAHSKDRDLSQRAVQSKINLKRQDPESSVTENLR